MTATARIVTDKREQFAFHDDIVYLRETTRGLTRQTVEEITEFKEEPVDAPVPAARLDHFQKRAMPAWTDGLDGIDFDKIVYYRKPSEREEKSWDDVPERSRRRSSGSASRRRSASSLPESAPSTTRRSSTTASAKS